MHSIATSGMSRPVSMITAISGSRDNALAGLQSLDDILQHALQKPVEQVSLLPFPGKIKSAAMAMLGGVLRPLSKAAAGGLALALATRAELLPLITVASAAVAFMIYTRHRTTYMAALENALARHAVDFTGRNDTPFQVGREALAVIDKAFDDPDPTVVVFAASLLEQLPVEESIPRATKLLGHDIPEVRAEAATVLSRLEHDDDDFAAVAVVERLKTEDDSFGDRGPTLRGGIPPRDPTEGDSALRRT